MSNNSTEMQNKYQEENDNNLTVSQKKRIISVLFGRLLKMHRSIMIVLTIVHAVIILLVCFHMFTLGTIESENKYCYLTWPLMHLYYAFVNYIFAWFCCYNSCEIANVKAPNVLRVSKKFLRIFTFFCFTPFPLKILADRFCRNWTYGTDAVLRQTGHLLVETIGLYIYFSWFEKKYTGFRVFYKETVFQ